MSAVQKICAACGGLFTIEDEERSSIVVFGKSMIGKFTICDQCAANNYELPTNKNTVASAPHTPTAWTSSF